ncbi:hypothetical protein QUF54_04665 [Candidatus Marithioploca araucensis]|uniref:Uncharacterized protein n=1 Tax=Candidatus Marithioploca araucensis TaxID=70273 RepID=A0ABT7VSU5_9GAMM|nr:hypothetical protein [Candidatus Marithioploca araucensis]
MKVNITDSATFEALNPSNIEKYLMSQQWREVKRINGEAALWVKSHGDKYSRILLPLDSNLGDFALSMSHVVSTLAQVENRSQLEVLEDFDTLAIGDVIRIKGLDIFNRNTSTLPFFEGILLIQQAKDLILAGARAVIEKKALFAHRQPSEVSTYLKTIRLGQTERGSYVMKLISPLLPQEQLTIPNLPNDELPFERRAIQSLMQGLNTLQQVATITEKKGTFYFERFQEVVSEGVSANLCEAVIGGKSEDNIAYKPLAVNVSWSSVYPMTSSICDNVFFQVNIMPHIAKAATLFRERTPEEVKLAGYVIKLERGKHYGVGIITVSDRALDNKYKVKIELNESDYEMAVQAHQNWWEISCQGELIKEGNYYRLYNPINFIVSKED